jgi:sirohydrochlorin ferrochelatase
LATYEVAQQVRTRLPGVRVEVAFADVRRAALLLGARTGGAVRVGYAATAAPRIAEVVAATPGRVTVCSWLLAPGVFHDLATRSGARIVSAPLGAHPRVADLIARRYLESRCYTNAA